MAMIYSELDEWAMNGGWKSEEFSIFLVSPLLAVSTHMVLSAAEPQPNRQI
jgi:hypothetical protein